MKKVTVLITGVSTPLGQAVVDRLMHENPFHKVIGVDRLAPHILGPVHFINADVATVDVGDLCVMNGVEVVLHLAGGTPKGELAAAQRLLEMAALVGVRRLVFPSWDQVYEPSGAPCDEDAALRRPEGLDPALAARVRVERMLESYAAENPGAEVVSVRTAPVIGPDRGTTFDQLLELPLIVGPPGKDPLVQLLHVDDAAEYFVRAASRPDIHGPINAFGADPIPLSVFAGVLQKRLWCPPAAIGSLAVHGASRLFRSPVRPDVLRILHDGVPLVTRHPRSFLGFEPRYSTRQTLAVWRTRYGCHFAVEAG